MTSRDLNYSFLQLDDAAVFRFKAAAADALDNAAHGAN
jgi:hypothetical protein